MSEARTFKAVLFDVNHTLIGIRDEKAARQSTIDVLWREVTLVSGIAYSQSRFRQAIDKAWLLTEQESYTDYRETKFEEVVARALSELEITVTSETLATVLESHMQPLYQAAYPLPGILELFDFLSSRVQIGAITNYKYAQGMRNLLQRTGVAQYLQSVAISSEVGERKPSLSIYRFILEQLKVDPTDCVLVGNEIEKDLWQGRKLGMTTILFVPDEHRWHNAEFADVLRAKIDPGELYCDYAVKTTNELRALLEGLVSI